MQRTPTRYSFPRSLDPNRYDSFPLYCGLSSPFVVYIDWNPRRIDYFLPPTTRNEILGHFNRDDFRIRTNFGEWSIPQRNDVGREYVPPFAFAPIRVFIKDCRKPSSIRRVFEQRGTMLSSLILSCYLSNYSSLLLAFFIEISRSVWLSLAVRSCLYTLMNAVVQRAKAITFNYSAKRTSRLPTNCTAQAINGPYKNRFVSPGIRFSFTCIVKDKRAEEIVGDLSC